MFNWIILHKEDIWIVFASIVTTASVIAKLTPSSLDDKIIGKILKLISLNK